MRALIPGALCALLLAAAPAAAQDWLKKIPLAPKLTTRAEEPKPELPRYAINLYVSDQPRGRAEEALADLVREAYRAGDFMASSPRSSPSISAA